MSLSFNFTSELPLLTTPPKLTRHGREAYNLTVDWPRWDRRRGDTGDGPIMWYSLHYRDDSEAQYTLAGQVYDTNCRDDMV